jgi:hypothetical protein
MSGYSNYNDPYTSNREYDLEQRPKIGIALWPEQLGSNESRNPMCEFDPHIKLQLVDNGSMWFCRECGNKIPVAEVKQDRKLVRKHGTRTSATMITSLPGADRAKRKPKSSRELAAADTSTLTAEDKQDFAGWGLNL